jgi:hypothetical protein
MGPIKAWPSSILLTMTAGQHLHKTINLSPRSNADDGHAFRVTGVSVDSKNGVVEFQNQSHGALVTLDYRAPLGITEDRGQIIASILYGGKPYKIQIGYMAMISPS